MAVPRKGNGDPHPGRKEEPERSAAGAKSLAGATIKPPAPMGRSGEEQGALIKRDGIEEFAGTGAARAGGTSGNGTLGLSLNELPGSPDEKLSSLPITRGRLPFPPTLPR